MSKKVVYASKVFWRIENIGSYSKDLHGGRVRSPEFVLRNLEGSQWQLSFHKDKKGDFDVLLVLLAHDRQFSFNCEWSLLDANGKTLLSISTQYQPSEKDRIFRMFDPYQPGDLTLDRSSMFLVRGVLSVRLLIWKNKAFFDPPERFSMVTRILDKPPAKNLMWQIENFLAFQLRHEARATVRFNDNVFKLSFFLTGESLEGADLNFGVSIENDNLKSLRVRISFFNELKKCFFNECEKQHGYNNSTKGKQTWVLSKLALMREILEAKSDWLNGADQVLTFQCDFEYDLRSYVDSCIEMSYRGPEDMMGPFFGCRKEEKEIKQCPKTVISTVLNGRVLTSLFWTDFDDEREMFGTAMGRDLYFAYSSCVLSDFELLADDARFRVHKVALYARSQLFRVLLEGMERDMESLLVPDLDKATLGRMVAFLYSGTLHELDWWGASQLYRAADKYGVPSLKLECSKSLRSNLAPSNVCSVLELADRYEDRELTASVLDYVEDNFDEVIFSDEWDNFLERSHLAGWTMIEICKRRSAAVPTFCGDKVKNGKE